MSNLAFRIRAAHFFPYTYERAVGLGRRGQALVARHLSYGSLSGVRQDFQGQLPILNFPLHHLLRSNVLGSLCRPAGDIDLVAVDRKTSVLCDNTAEAVKDLLFGQVLQRLVDDLSSRTLTAKCDGVISFGREDSAHPCVASLRFAFRICPPDFFPDTDERILVLYLCYDALRKNHRAQQQ